MSEDRKPLGFLVRSTTAMAVARDKNAGAEHRQVP
jgi:hypothetical protein